MPKNDTRLGRGLSAIFGDLENIDGEDRIESVSLDLIVKNRFQPRSEFDKDDLTQLAESIKQNGVIQPILLRQIDDKYEIIAGERRFLAAKLANLKSIPAIIKNITDQESAEIALIENLQRKDLNPVEEAFAYKNLMEKFGYTQEEVAKRVSKDRATISNTLRLLNLPDKILDMLKNGDISAGHARALLSLKEEKEQLSLANEIKEKKLSVRDAESSAKNNIDMNKFKQYEEKLKTAFSKSKIRYKNNKGKIEIEFKNEEELNSILERIGI